MPIPPQAIAVPVGFLVGKGIERLNEERRKLYKAHKRGEHKTSKALCPICGI